MKGTIKDSFYRIKTVFSDYRMCRLTFGVSSCPFLATLVLKQTTFDYKKNYHSAVQVVLNQFYQFSTDVLDNIPEELKESSGLQTIADPYMALNLLGHCVTCFCSLCKTNATK